ncbi:nucleotidyltransferase domain-containing protein [Streptomyces sp. NRRL S-337]|uniref:nucleotidyltransferase domain-containing protein n=1 Tax=Streptomyces sp. NRRL S-337 TaxID=1463900 RepID=UPI0004C4D3F7|nr:nucleotidyltransferase domain-containing protein [Streptomyces sp. NRRL S-337]
MDHHGVIFKVIGDSHPGSHYLGYVKYHPDAKGDRRLFGQTYRQNSVVSKSFGILANRPECYVYSDTLGCVITGIPRDDIVVHYSCRHALVAIHEDPGLVADSPAGKDLLAITEWVAANGAQGLIGVTGSFLVGCHNERSDLDLVCYGPEGYEAAHALFHHEQLIKPYEGDDLTRLYIRRAKYMEGSSFDALIKQERRKLQGLTAHAGAHINCEPIRADRDKTFACISSKEIGEISLLAEITDHAQGLATPAVYEIKVKTVLSSTVDEPASFAHRITHMRSYLGAYTGAFRSGDTVHLSGKLVHTQDGERSGFGIELTPWTVSNSYVASLAG